MSIAFTGATQAAHTCRANSGPLGSVGRTSTVSDQKNNGHEHVWMTNQLGKTICGLCGIPKHEHFWTRSNTESNIEKCRVCGTIKSVEKATQLPILSSFETIEPKYPLLAAINNACQKLGM